MEASALATTDSAVAMSCRYNELTATANADGTATINYGLPLREPILLGNGCNVSVNLVPIATV